PPWMAGVPQMQDAFCGRQRAVSVIPDDSLSAHRRRIVMHYTEITQGFAGLDETNLPRHGTRAQWSAGNGRTWAIVLAAGAGTRLRLLTTNPAWIPVPKQYCSLDSGPSLLRQALARAFSIVPRWRTSVVVAEQQVQWWGPLARELPGTVAVQPEDRGTAIGILLALVRILERDPNARVVILPADHHVIDERALTRTLRNAIGALLYGHAYIVPVSLGMSGLLGIAKFVEKPARAHAARLIAAGALWNTFIMVANARELLELLRGCEPTVVADLQRCLQDGLSEDGPAPALRELYRRLPVLDFSRDIAQWNSAAFSALRAPACGWTDLGTVDRVRKALWQHAKAPGTGSATAGCELPALSLAHALRSERLPGQAGRDLPNELGVSAIEMMSAR